MRVTFPVCAAGVTLSSLWLTASLLAPGQAAQPAVNQSTSKGQPSGEVARLDDTPRRAGPLGQFVLRGRVVEAGSGRPVSKATVEGSSEDNGVFSETTTDQRGEWALTRLPAGSYNVTVRKADYQVRYSGLPLIALTDARPERILNLTLARGGLLSGRVTDAAGRPASGVMVGLLRAMHGPQGTTFQFEGEMAPADERGEFRLSGLREGEYVLAARGDESAFGLGSQRRTNVTTYYPGTPVVAEAQRLNIGEGTAHVGLTFAMQTLPTVRVSGRVVSSTGHPVDASVSVQNRNTGFFSGGWSFGKPRDSRFSVEHLTRGRYTLVASAQLPNGVREAGAVDVTVGDSDIAGLVLRTEPPTTLRGRVVAEGYESWNLDWMRVGAMPVDLSGTIDAEVGTVQQDRTFKFQTHLAPARIVAFQPLGGWEVKAVRWKGREASDGLLSFQRGETVSDVEVILRRRASILEGNVSDPTDCTFVVVLQRANGAKPACVTTSPVRDGEFRTLPLPAGDYRVVAANGPFTTPVPSETLWDLATPVTVTDDQTTTLTLKVQARR